MYNSGRLVCLRMGMTMIHNGDHLLIRGKEKPRAKMAALLVGPVGLDGKSKGVNFFTSSGPMVSRIDEGKPVYGEETGLFVNARKDGDLGAIFAAIHEKFGEKP